MKPSTVVALSLLCALSMSPRTGLAIQQSAELAAAWSDVREYWSSSARASDVVGSSLMLLKDGEVLRSEFFGEADRASGREVDAPTIFHWASITKTFTGIAIMQLRDRGMLDLDDSIVDYVPEFREVYDPFGDRRAVTIRHLMSHASGLRAPTWPWGGDKPWHPHEPTRWEQLVAMFPYTEILFEPGSKYSYSNPGVILLGRVIERLTGDDYEVYMEKNVLRPLGMERSYFDTTPYHLLPYRSNNYDIVEGELRTNGLDFDTGITVSNGGLNAPLTDMARYLAFLSGNVEPDSPAAGVLARASLEEMWQSQQPIEADDDGTWTMGLSYFLLDTGAAHIVGHTGSQKGFRSFFYLDPATGAAAVAVWNTTVISRAPGVEPTTDDTGFSGTRSRILKRVFPLLSSEQ
jgi:CubicO group peptidase (beta-lactamase class C family)